MTVCGSTVWASDDSSEKGIEGWEVVGDITCTPIDEYEGTLDKDAPSAGYVLDLRLVNSDVVDYYVSPTFYFDMINSDGESVEIVLLNFGNIYSPDALLGSGNICVQDTVEVKAGQVVNVQYYIDANQNNYMSYAEYGTDQEEAYNNGYIYKYGETGSFENPEMYLYLETEEKFAERYEEAKAQYEASNAQTEQDNTQQGDVQQDATPEGNAQQNSQSSDEDVLGEIAGRIASNAIDRVGREVEEKTDGIIDKETLAKGAAYLFGNN